MAAFSPAFPPQDLIIRRSTDAKLNKSDTLLLPPALSHAYQEWWERRSTFPKTFVEVTFTPSSGAAPRRTFCWVDFGAPSSPEGTITVPSWVLQNLGSPSGCQGTRCIPQCDSSCDLHPCAPHPNAPCSGRLPEGATVSIAHVQLPTARAIVLTPLCREWERAGSADTLALAMQSGHRNCVVAGQVLMVVTRDGRVWHFRVGSVAAVSDGQAGGGGGGGGGEEVRAVSLWDMPGGSCNPEMVFVQLDQRAYDSMDAGVHAATALPPGAAKIPTLLVRAHPLCAPTAAHCVLPPHSPPPFLPCSTRSSLGQPCTRVRSGPPSPTLQARKWAMGRTPAATTPPS